VGRRYGIVALPGEGVGPEVVEAALRVLDRLARRSGVEIQVERAEIGLPALARRGSALPEETARRCQASDGILLGAVAQAGLLELRSRFDFFANLRPVRAFDFLLDASSLRPERVRGLDLLFVRELTGGIYFGPAGRGEDERGPFGQHTMLYHDWQVRRIARVALQRARLRRGLLTVGHKENALPQIPWCRLVQEEAAAFPGVRVETMLADRLGMELVCEPTRFDVIVTDNLLGDWASSLGGALAGSIGLLPSASLNEAGLGLYEPIHGTAPEIAGRGIANPLGAIDSTRLMLEQWGEDEMAAALAEAQRRVLERGVRTADLLHGPGARVVGTEEMADAVIAALP
jgi:3-isopropylmalate dehydrogenase/3-benzylmalate dehydrogenase